MWKTWAFFGLFSGVWISYPQPGPACLGLIRSGCRWSGAGAASPELGRVASPGAAAWDAASGPWMLDGDLAGPASPGVLGPGRMSGGFAWCGSGPEIRRRWAGAVPLRLGPGGWETCSESGGRAAGAVRIGAAWAGPVRPGLGVRGRGGDCEIFNKDKGSPVGFRF